MRTNYLVLFIFCIFCELGNLRRFYIATPDSTFLGFHYTQPIVDDSVFVTFSVHSNLESFLCQITPKTWKRFSRRKAEKTANQRECQLSPSKVFYEKTLGSRYLNGSDTVIHLTNNLVWILRPPNNRGLGIRTVVKKLSSTQDL